MAQKTVKIKLSEGSLQFKRNTSKGIEVCICGKTKNGSGKWHEINIVLDETDMLHVVECSKNWARDQFDAAVKFLNQLNDNSDTRK